MQGCGNFQYVCKKRAVQGTLGLAWGLAQPRWCRSSYFKLGTLMHPSTGRASCPMVHRGSGGPSCFTLRGESSPMAHPPRRPKLTAPAAPATRAPEPRSLAPMPRDPRSRGAGSPLCYYRCFHKRRDRRLPQDAPWEPVPDGLGSGPDPSCSGLSRSCPSLQKIIPGPSLSGAVPLCR